MKNLNLYFLPSSPWPIFLSMSLFTLSLNLVNFFNEMNLLYVFLSLILNLLLIFMWWMDLIIESSFEGNHSNYIMNILMFSFILFIISELFFFVSFFWSFLHSMMSPDIFIGCYWPPIGVESINFKSLPLLNSLLLISSGLSITWSHYKLLSNKFSSSLKGLKLTIFLGILFFLIQLFEYLNSNFSFSDSIFSSVFFISTGFHGIHVIIGMLFLYFSFLRFKNLMFSKNHFLGFEFSIWYWHFVDVIWLYLYLLVYWFSSF